MKSQNRNMERLIIRKTPNNLKIVVFVVYGFFPVDARKNVFFYDNHSPASSFDRDKNDVRFSFSLSFDLLASYTKVLISNILY